MHKQRWNRIPIAESAYKLLTVLQAEEWYLGIRQAGLVPNRIHSGEI